MKYVFIVGCPRSGTTWLQMLLAQHPRVATSQETHLFSSYIAPLRERWESNSRSARGIGLPGLMTAGEFDDLCARLAREIMDRVGATTGDSEVVIEKTPNHVWHIPSIVRIFPQAYFIHVVRDPRAVVLSLTHAGRGWGRHWASSDIATNASRWLHDVDLGQRGSKVTANFMEVRYEHLAGPDGPALLDSLLSRLGLRTGASFSRDAFEACRIDRLQDAATSVKNQAVVANDPKGFYGAGPADSWKSLLSPQDIRIVEYLTRDAMRALGYAPVSGRYSRRPPLKLRTKNIVDAAEQRVLRTVRYVFSRLRPV